MIYHTIRCDRVLTIWLHFLVFYKHYDIIAYFFPNIIAFKIYCITSSFVFQTRPYKHYAYTTSPAIKIDIEQSLIDLSTDDFFRWTVPLMKYPWSAAVFLTNSPLWENFPLTKRPHTVICCSTVALCSTFPLTKPSPHCFPRFWNFRESYACLPRGKDN